MRHRNRLAKLARPADQRNAIVRSLLTKLFLHDEIVTSKARAKVVRSQADRIITMAKKGDLSAIRKVAALIYAHETSGKTIADTRRKDGNVRQITETVLRRIFRTVVPRAENRTSGYTRCLPMARRRGDNAPMALIQLVDAFEDVKRADKPESSLVAQSASPTKVISSKAVEASVATEATEATPAVTPEPAETVAPETLEENEKTDA
ncbi:MAG: 50S ribosomal protein L17 [Vampirovibrionales bacterium]|nr:50S ribosomal protein L17 [Vampirovibrionales bacterium]